MKRIFLVLSFLVLSFTIFAGTDSEALKKIGYVKDGKYCNDYFKLSLSVKKDWAIQDEDTKRLIADTGADVAGKSNEKLKKMIEASKQRTFYMLCVSKCDMRESKSFNPSLMIVAEDISQFKTIKTGYDYLLNSKEILKTTNLGYKIDEKLLDKNINGLKFSNMKTTISNGNINVIQDYYTIVKSGYAITMILTYTNSEEKIILENMINSIKNI